MDVESQVTITLTVQEARLLAEVLGGVVRDDHPLSPLVAQLEKEIEPCD